MSDPARRQFIAGLRALASFYEGRPEAYYDGMRLTVSMYTAGRRAPRALAAMAAAFAEEDKRGGAAGVGSRKADLRQPVPAERCGGAARAVLARNFGPKVRLELFVPGAGCACCRKPAQVSETGLPPRILEKCANVEMGPTHGDWMVESGTR